MFRLEPYLPSLRPRAESFYAQSPFDCKSEYWRCTITVSSDRGCALRQVVYGQLTARARISAALKVKAPSRASLGPFRPRLLQDTNAKLSGRGGDWYALLQTFPLHEIPALRLHGTPLLR